MNNEIFLKRGYSYCEMTPLFSFSYNSSSNKTFSDHIQCREDMNKLFNHCLNKFVILLNIID